jgi:hypothetical protein
VSLESLTTLVLSIPEGVIERRTAVHPVRAFTSIWCDCVGWLVDTWKGDCLGNSPRVRNLMMHCIFVRSQTNSYQVLEILR